DIAFDVDSFELPPPLRGSLLRSGYQGSEYVEIHLKDCFRLLRVPLRSTLG
ncbi:hypothetical protein EVA_10781, partial [gut metagenome]